MIWLWLSFALAIWTLIGVGFYFTNLGFKMLGIIFSIMFWPAAILLAILTIIALLPVLGISLIF